MAPSQLDPRVATALRWRDALEAVARDAHRDDDAWHGKDHRGDPVPVERVLLLLDVLTCEECGHVPDPPRTGPVRTSPGPDRLTAGPRRAEVGTAAPARAGRSSAVGDLTAAPRHVPHKGSRWHNLWHLLHG